MNLSTACLAFRPFLDPLHLERYWYLLIVPMALGISLAYKAVRVQDMRKLWPQTLVMTVQIVAGMIALGTFTFIFVQYILPAITLR
jgi:hypothetical protein